MERRRRYRRQRCSGCDPLRELLAAALGPTRARDSGRDSLGSALVPRRPFPPGTKKSRGVSGGRSVAEGTRRLRDCGHVDRFQERMETRHDRNADQAPS